MVDIETNGLALDANILEISVRAIDKKSYPTDIEFLSLIRSTKKLCSFSKSSGFYEEILNKEDYPLKVFKRLRNWTFDNFHGKVIPIGHNYLGFDKYRLQVSMGDFYDKIFHYHSEDTMQIARNLRNAGFIKSDSCSLKALINYFKFDDPRLEDLRLKGLSFHRASADTLYTGLIYNKLMKIYKPNLFTRITRVFIPTYSGV